MTPQVQTHLQKVFTKRDATRFRFPVLDPGSTNADQPHCVWKVRASLPSMAGAMHEYHSWMEQMVGMYRLKNKSKKKTDADGFLKNLQKRMFWASNYQKRCKDVRPTAFLYSPVVQRAAKRPLAYLPALYCVFGLYLFQPPSPTPYQYSHFVRSKLFWTAAHKKKPFIIGHPSLHCGWQIYVARKHCKYHLCQRAFKKHRIYSIVFSGSVQ